MTSEDRAAFDMDRRLYHSTRASVVVHKLPRVQHRPEEVLGRFRFVAGEAGSRWCVRRIDVETLGRDLDFSISSNGMRCELDSERMGDLHDRLKTGLGPRG